MTITEAPSAPTDDAAGAPGWGFVTQPKWLLSHLFALAMIGLCLTAMVWQLNRRDQRLETIAIISERSEAPSLTVAAAIGTLPADELDYRRITDAGTWQDPDLVRVANRSQNGVAGEWVVGVFRTRNDVAVLVNRGFVELNAEPEPPPEEPVIVGWLRDSIEQEGFGATDTGEGPIVPRLNIDDIAQRAPGIELAPVWVQLDSPTGAAYPQPVPLPALDEGPHLSYAIQWAIFASMGAVAYVVLLRRIAGGKHRRAAVAPNAP